MKKEKKALKEEKPPKEKKRVASKKYWIIGGIALAVILLALVLLFLGIKINLFGGDAGIQISPVQQVISASESVPLNFSVGVRGSCKYECNFSMYDPYKGERLFLETQTLNSSNRITKTYNIPLDTKGYGERVYYFEAECSKVPSIFCRGYGGKQYRSAFVSVNFQPSEAEQLLEAEALKLLTKSSDAYSESLALLEATRELIGEIDGVVVCDYSVQAETQQITSLRKRLEQAATLWQQYDYSGAQTLFSQPSQDVYGSLLSINQKITSNIWEYNNAGRIFKRFALDWPKLEEAYSYHLWKSPVIAQRISQLRRNITIIRPQFITTPLSRIGNLGIKRMNTSFSQIVDSYEKGETLAEVALPMIAQHQKIQSTTFSLLGISKPLEGNDTCSKLMLLSENYRELGNNASARLSLYSNFSNTPEFFTIRQAYISFVNGGKIKPGYNSSEYQLNRTRITNTLNLTPKDYAATLSFDYAELKKLASAACAKLRGIEIKPLEEINASLNLSRSVPGLVIEKPQPSCCIFNECKPCGLNTTPVILLHGHSPMESNPVEESLGVFSLMQRKMGYEGFINAGDIDIKTPMNSDIWSEMGSPITIRASYYYIMYYDVGLSASVLKTESIENYAIRLKELIDIVVARTGAKKVNIVAHSMGGLVAREYIMLFGEDKVDKVILIGTPNQGITGLARKFCSTIGSVKECKDMYKDSVFMKRLSAFKPKVPVHVIYGTGCDTAGKDGDGIVVAEDALLPYAKAYQINGTCTDILGLNLHSRLLDPGQFPEVYNLVVRLLKD